MKHYTTVGKVGLLGFVLFTLPLVTLAQSGYWQQEVNTEIKVSLDDVHQFLRGKIRMVYKNNSPDTLRFIYLHLYPNAFENDRTAYDTQAVENGDTHFYYASEKDHGHIDSMNFVVNGRSAELKILNNIDEGKLVLPEPLLPGDSVIISSPFRVKIPYVFSRMGHVGQAYQISQWYPKPAVYDKKGWHIFPYLDQGEYYGEFGTYNVFITLPKNYILMATGYMVHAPKEQKWLDSLAALPLPPDTLYKNTFPSSASELKTIHFRAEKVHDFAWFADKRWIVRKNTLNLQGNPQPVIAYRCFLPEHQKGWKNSSVAMKTAMEGYSKAVGPYPYKTVKVVDGALSADAGGMEYPTIAVIASSNAPGMIDEDIIHEVGHNWFYGMLGSNERAYPWMDEGINSFYEQKFSTDRNYLKGRSLNYWAYALVAGLHDLQPADTASTVYTAVNYGVDIYEKVPLYLRWLEAYIGTDTFRLAMQDYYRQFRFKHPQPEDFQRIFQKSTSKDIKWFFTAMKNNRPVDFSVKSFRQSRDSLSVQLKNNSGFAAPALLDFENDSDEKSKKTNYHIWTKPFEGEITINIPNQLPQRNWTDVAISKIVPDFNPSDNSAKKTIALRPFLGLNDSHLHEAWLLPSIGYNYYDGFMIGLALHDLTVPQNRFQFAVAPMFGTNSKKFVGTGFVSYTWFYHKGWLHDFTFKVEGKTFDYEKSDLNIDHFETAGYRKVSPELVFNIRKPYPRSPIIRTLRIKGYWIQEQSLSYSMNPEDSLYRPSDGSPQTEFYGKARYDFYNARTFNPFGYSFEGQIGKDFAKLSVEADFRVDYYAKNKSFYIRGYFGKMFGLTNNPLDWQRYDLSATSSGWNDYLYDETFLGRNQNTGIWANQIAIREGGFKMNTLQYADPVGITDNWLAALNLQTDLPFGKLPLRVFGDLAALPKVNGQTGVNVIYEAGLSLHFGKVLTIYAPLALSKDLNDYAKSILGKNRVWKSVSFSLNLNEIPWTKLSGSLMKILE